MRALWLFVPLTVVAYPASAEADDVSPPDGVPSPDGDAQDAFIGETVGMFLRRPTTMPMWARELDVGEDALWLVVPAFFDIGIGVRVVLSEDPEVVLIPEIGLTLDPSADAAAPHVGLAIAVDRFRFGYRVVAADQPYHFIYFGFAF